MSSPCINGCGAVSSRQVHVAITSANGRIAVVHHAAVCSDGCRTDWWEAPTDETLPIDHLPEDGQLRVHVIHADPSHAAELVSTAIGHAGREPIFVLPGDVAGEHTFDHGHEFHAWWKGQA